MQRNEDSEMVDTRCDSGNIYIGFIKPSYILVKRDASRPMSCTYFTENEIGVVNIHRNVLVDGIGPMHRISPCYWFSLAEESDYQNDEERRMK